MTGGLWLDWAMLGVSLFNALLLLWMGLTVLLNAERRVWGIWLSSGALLLGSFFFFNHSIILETGISVITPGLNFWLQLGWVPVSALPFMWYLAVLWYSGYWDHPHAQAVNGGGLYRRQRRWFALTLLYGLVLIGFLYLANPLPSMLELADGQSAATPAIAGIPIVILAYQIFILLCIGLSIDALRHPEISGRLLGELAQIRARRWLIATSVVLLGVALLVGWVMIWILNNTWRGLFQKQMMTNLGWFDLVIAGMIAISVLLLGQAVVSYEVFTGKTLPRRGLAIYWRRTVILATGFSAMAAGSLTSGVAPIVTLSLSAIVMITFYALLGWRAFTERGKLIENLRPFATSQKMIENLLRESDSSERFNNADLSFPFQAMCVNVLETAQAGLFAYGPLATLADQASYYPPDLTLSPPDLDSIACRLKETSEISVAIEPSKTGGMILAIPLWRDGGLCGVILLGQKINRGPYSQEEIEIAQATGERLIDAQASAEMARRLISLQRQNLVAGQVIDQRVRRRLHDEILPQVHTATLGLVSENEARFRYAEVVQQLQQIHAQLSNLLQSMPPASSPDIEQTGLLGALRHTINHEMNGAFEEVDWKIESQAALQAKGLPALIAEVIYSAVREGLRNAARHSRGENGQFPLCLQIVMQSYAESGLRIIVEDNGVGFEHQEIQEKFDGELAHLGACGGFTEGQCENKDPTNSRALIESRITQGGSGRGLALYSTLMAVIGGSLKVDSRPGHYTRLIVEIPATAWEN